MKKQKKRRPADSAGIPQTGFANPVGLTMTTLTKKSLLFLALLALPAWTALLHSQDFSKVQIRTTKVAENIYMLTGAGGNIGVSAGADGILLIDSQFAQLHDKIMAALAAIAPGPVRFLCNTNWHYDHVSGNEPFAKAGAVIIAQEIARHRMLTEQTHADLGITLPPYPAAALPAVTCSESLTIHFNGDEIQVVHIPGAHSDTDLLFHFKKANVIHSGDLVFSGFYPYIDVAHGGSINGVILAVEQILGMGDAATRLIPGHGPLLNRADLEPYRDMLVQVRNRVAALLNDGKNKEEILAAKPTADLDGRWQGSIPAAMFITLVYESLVKNK
jgi:cyclase